MAGNVELTMTLKDAQLVLGLVKQAREMEKNEAAIKKNTKASSDWAQGLKNVQAAAKEASQASWSAGMAQIAQVNSAIESQKKMVDQFVSAKAAVAKGPDPFAAGLKALGATSYKPDAMLARMEANKRAELEKTAEQQKQAAEELAVAEKKAAAEAKRFGDETRRLVATPVERYKARMMELDRALKQGTIDQETFNRAAGKAKEELDEVGKSSEQSFGASALASISNYAAGLLTIGTVLSTIKGSFDKVAEARTKAMESLDQMQDPNRDLAQLIRPGQTMQDLLDKRDALALKSGITRQEATNTLFAADSGGLSESQMQLAARAGLLAPAAENAQFMGKIKAIYGKDIKPEAALNVAMKAAADNQLNMEHFTRNSPTSLNPAKALGLSFEETAAILGMMSNVTGAPEETFTLFEDLAGKLAIDERFQGKGMAGISQLFSMNKDELDKITGSDRGKNMALRMMKEQWENINAYVPELQAANRATGTAKDAIATQAAGRLAVPSERAAYDKRRAALAEDIARERGLGTGAAGTEALFASQRAEDEVRGASGMSRFGRAAGQFFSWGMGFEGERARMVSDYGASFSLNPFAGIRASDYGPQQPAADPKMDEQTAVLKEIRDALKTPQPPARRPAPRPVQERR